MDEHKHHEELIKNLYQEQKEIFDSSDQAIYAYLDDNHKVCNQKFARLLGFTTATEWAKTGGSMLEMSVADKSQELLAHTYGDAMERLTGGTIKVTWKKKSGGTVDTNVILVPIASQGHLFALHFIS